jgi:hypothetical protein
VEELGEREREIEREREREKEERECQGCYTTLVTLEMEEGCPYAGTLSGKSKHLPALTRPLTKWQPPSSPVLSTHINFDL